MNKLIPATVIVVLTFSLVPLSASTIESRISTSGSVNENQWLYTGLTSYQGYNTAKFYGDKTGNGKVEYIDQIDWMPNKTACSKEGDPKKTLSCSKSVDPDHKSQTRGRYTNLVGTAKATVSMID